MAISLKRNLSYDKDVASDHEISSLKKPKLSSFGCNLLFSRQDADNSSTDDESVDEGEFRSRVVKKKVVTSNNKKLRRQRRDQRNIKRTLGSTPMDSKLSKAVAQYSDDDEESESESYVNSTQQMNRSFSTSSNHLTSIPSPPQFEAVLPVKSRSYLPECDFSARSRCFDYLIGAIDEAWARYCDATASAEDEVYGYDTGAPHTPASIATSDDEDGYRSEISATTNITDYETDYDDSKNRSHATMTLNDTFGNSYNNVVNNNNNNNNSNGNRVSEAPANVRLQELKDRLIKAKYFLQDYVDSSDPKHSLMFWKRWDLIKYVTIELVEDDDEDEVIESTIEDLETGRFEGSLCA